MRFFAFAAYVACVVGCSGGGSNNPGDGGPTGDGGVGGDGGACGSAVCSDSTCGTVTDGCGTKVECSRCRFSSDDVTTNGSQFLALSVSPQIAVASASTLYSKGSTWTADAVTNMPTGANITSLAVAPDGSRWVSYLDGSQVGVAHEASGVWSIEQVPVPGSSHAPPRIAVGSDGTVYCAFAGEDTKATYGMVLARRTTSGTWSATTVAPTALMPDYADLALVAGEPWIVWADQDHGSLQITMSNAGTFTTELVDPKLTAHIDHHLSMAVDASGSVHVAYRQHEPFLREIDHAVRVNGAWHLDKASVMHYGSQGDVRMAAAPNGDLAVVYEDEFGIGLATFHAGTWAKQPLSPAGDTFALAYDGASTLYAAIATSSALRLLTRAGNYPADYVPTCAAIAASVCPQACQCGPKCCYASANGGNSCTDPEPFCEEAIAWPLCGDVSQDPAAVYTCSGAVSGLTCSSSGVTLPTSCPYVF